MIEYLLYAIVIVWLALKATLVVGGLYFLGRIACGVWRQW
jgi:hypothetical protein